MPLVSGYLILLLILLGSLLHFSFKISELASNFLTSVHSFQEQTFRHWRFVISVSWPALLTDAVARSYRLPAFSDREAPWRPYAHKIYGILQL